MEHLSIRDQNDNGDNNDSIMDDDEELDDDDDEELDDDDDEEFDEDDDDEIEAMQNLLEQVQEVKATNAALKQTLGSIHDQRQQAIKQTPDDPLPNKDKQEEDHSQRELVASLLANRADVVLEQTREYIADTTKKDAT